MNARLAMRTVRRSEEFCVARKVSVSIGNTAAGMTGAIPYVAITWRVDGCCILCGSGSSWGGILLSFALFLRNGFGICRANIGSISRSRIRIVFFPFILCASVFLCSKFLSIKLSVIFQVWCCFFVSILIVVCCVDWVGLIFSFFCEKVKSEKNMFMSIINTHSILLNSKKQKISFLKTTIRTFIKFQFKCYSWQIHILLVSP